MAALAKRLSGNQHGCYPEAGSGAIPERQQRNTARIPDALIRCTELPRVTFEIVSPSELKDWRTRDKRRRDLQDVEGVTEVVEIYQSQPANHVYRKGADGAWTFHPIGESYATLNLVGAVAPMSMPLSEIYEFATPTDDDQSDATE